MCIEWSKTLDSLKEGREGSCKSLEYSERDSPRLSKTCHIHINSYFGIVQVIVIDVFTTFDVRLQWLGEIGGKMNVTPDFGFTGITIGILDIIIKYL